jgi:hypothetical protein
MRTQGHSSGKQRQLLYVPDINPHSFLLFFQRGESWSLRDYSQRGKIQVHRSDCFEWTVDRVRKAATYCFNAPVVPITHLEFWHDEVVAKNREYLVKKSIHLHTSSLRRANEFPILALEELYKLSKSSKTGDMNRIRTSPRSEDWVTWNFLELMRQLNPLTWWHDIEEQASKFNSHAKLSFASDDEPQLRFWPQVDAPQEYEHLSRERMRNSGVPAFVRRAGLPGPVEGRTEIDVMLVNRESLVFIEAKLGSDISTNTKYDPARNQIVRNIDCLLDAAGDREPTFWMIVRDLAEDRMYVQLIRQYRLRPELLARDLPHRDQNSLRQIATRLAIICWRDLGDKWLHGTLNDNRAEAVRQELLKRI